MATAPHTTPYQRNRIGEGRQFFFVPGSRANRHLLTFGQLVCHQCHDREESKQRRSCSGNRQVTPLSLRFYSHVRPGLFKGHFDVVVATHKIIGLVFRTRVFKLKRDMQKRSRDASSSSTLRQNSMAEGIDETPTHSSATVCSGPSPTRASAAGDQDHSRTPGGGKCK
jgi:hypothetical protein